MNYSVGFDPEARQSLRNLSPQSKEEVNKVLNQLRAGPDYSRDQRLHRQVNLWRARAGRRWRVIYSVLPERRIQITRIRRRADAYVGIEHPGPPDVCEPQAAYQRDEVSVPAAAAD